MIATSNSTHFKPGVEAASLNEASVFSGALLGKPLKWVELDVAITKDEQLIIVHDDFLERTTNHKGEITQVAYDQIKSASAGSWHSTEFENEKIPTFDIKCRNLFIFKLRTMPTAS